MSYRANMLTKQRRTCCFFGHSETPEKIRPELETTVERHITEYNVTDFLVGNYGAFDRMSANTVKAMKKKYHGIKLFLMLPYLPNEGRPLPDMDGFDGSVYPEGMERVPRRYAISKLNKIMVEQSDYAIAYVCHDWGGAAKTLEQAHRNERKGLIHIENLAETK